MILAIAVYILLGYWAVGETIWHNKVVIGNIFFHRVMLGTCLGWILIPAAVLACIFRR